MVVPNGLSDGQKNALRDICGELDKSLQEPVQTQIARAMDDIAADLTKIEAVEWALVAPAVAKLWRRTRERQSLRRVLARVFCYLFDPDRDNALGPNVVISFCAACELTDPSTSLLRRLHDHLWAQLQSGGAICARLEDDGLGDVAAMNSREVEVSALALGINLGTSVFRLSRVDESIRDRGVG